MKSKHARAFCVFEKRSNKSLCNSLSCITEKNYPRYRDELFSSKFMSNTLLTTTIITAFFDTPQWNPPEKVKVKVLPITGH